MVFRLQSHAKEQAKWNEIRGLKRSMAELAARGVTVSLAELHDIWNGLWTGLSAASSRRGTNFGEVTREKVEEAELRVNDCPRRSPGMSTNALTGREDPARLDCCACFVVIQPNCHGLFGWFADDPVLL